MKISVADLFLICASSLGSLQGGAANLEISIPIVSRQLPLSSTATLAAEPDMSLTPVAPFS
jgi:hypothetical protein